MEAIEGKVGHFADSHASVTKQQEDAITQIIAAEQLFLHQLILLCGQRAGRARLCGWSERAPYAEHGQLPESIGERVIGTGSTRAASLRRKLTLKEFVKDQDVN